MTFIILFLSIMAGAVAESAATGMRALSANSNASKESSTPSEDYIIQWVKVTAVPLGVFLIGACIWGVIKNTAAWEYSLNVCGRRAVEADHQAPAENLLLSNGGNARDLEEGLQLPHRGMGDGLTTTSSPPASDARDGMQPEFEVPNNFEEIQSVGSNMQHML